MISLRNIRFQIINTGKRFFCHHFAAPTKEQTVRVDKWNINYVKVGRGPHHVLCLPSALGTIWTDFKPQIEGFDKENFTLVVWDPPGYGKSRPPDKDFTGDYHYKDADYAFEFMKALKIPKYSIMGWSDGGVSALIHAAKYPDAMMKLVGISTSAHLPPEQLKSFKQLRDVSTWSKSMKRSMEEVYGEYLQEYWNKWVDGLETVYKRDNGNVYADLLSDIKCPTFILYGEKDKIALPEHAINIAKNIDGARLHGYPDGKHNIHIKYFNDFNKRVQDFLLQPA